MMSILLVSALLTAAAVPQLQPDKNISLAEVQAAPVQEDEEEVIIMDDEEDDTDDDTDDFDDSDD
jgi:hypothetical protein